MLSELSVSQWSMYTCWMNCQSLSEAHVHMLNELSVSQWSMYTCWVNCQFLSEACTHAEWTVSLSVKPMYTCWMNCQSLSEAHVHMLNELSVSQWSPCTHAEWSQSLNCTMKDLNPSGLSKNNQLFNFALMFKTILTYLCILFFL